MRLVSGGRVAIPALLGIAILAMGATSSQAAPVGRVDAGPVYALVELSQQATASRYSAQKVKLGESIATTDAVAQLASVQREQNAFARTVASNVAGAREVYRLQRIFNGILYATTSDGVDALRRLPGVVSVRLVEPKVLDNASSMPFVNVTKLWEVAGLNLHGNGIKVGVIDTGVDYMHANFGGSGIALDYTNNDPNTIESSTFPTAKVVGGTDFAGHAYDAGNAETSVPVPDADPLDGDHHGSHVAGTIAGFGVLANGSTYNGTYDISFDPAQFRIGPGAAPQALLYALKVFGDLGGSTNLATKAVEWATDPNADGDFSDHLDVVNLSLGSSFGNSADTDAVFYRNAVKAGVVVVCSAGNANDVYFISGSPGATPEVISVAATQSDRVPYSGIQVNAPSNLAGVKVAGPASFGPTTGATGDVVAADTGTATPLNGCDPFTNAAAVAGKIAIIDRGVCTFKTKVKNAQDAGAIGVIIAQNQANATALPIPMGDDDTITATITIPSYMVTKSVGDAIRTELTNSVTVNVTFDSSLVAYEASQADVIASFSSRGPTRVGSVAVLKPDVAAPGVNIVSTGMGTGNESEQMSGTSMSSPLVAGVMALLRQRHPTWTPGELKALVMNTAGHDVTGTAGGAAMNPARAGAGRVDAQSAATATVIAYDKDYPERVSVSFATLDVEGATTEDRTITVENKGGASVTYDVTVVPAANAMPGAAVTLSGAAAVTVAGGASADVPIRLSADSAAMTRAHDATVNEGGPRYWLAETAGWVVFTPQGGGVTLRVPYYAALNAASDMHAAGPVLVSGKTGTTRIDLAGRGIDTTAITALPKGVLSLVTPMELVHTSPLTAPIDFTAPDLGETLSAHLRYVGVTSNWPDVGTVADAEIFFGLTTYGIWATPHEVEFDIFIKKAGALDWEYVLYNHDLNTSSTTPGNDIYVSRLVDLKAGAGGTEDYFNGISQTRYYVPVFLNDTMMLGVYPPDLGMTEDTSAIEFQIYAFSNNYGGAVDITPVLKYDVKKPAFATTVDPNLTRIGPGYTPFWTDKDGESIPVAYDLGAAQARGVKGILLLHHMNAAGFRGEVVSVVPMPELVATTALTVGSTACPSGGVQIDRGLDKNGNGVLDPAEVTYTQAICNGLDTIAATSAEPAGANCPTGGKRLDIGIDANANDVLEESEITNTSYVCNGHSGLVATVALAVGDAHCATGGTAVQSGIDLNDDGLLQDAEVTGTSYVCTGAKGDIGVTGPMGHSGCNALGGGEPAAFALLGLIGLVGGVRRRRKQ